MKDEFTGTWHIYEMETWDKGYFNREVQAYITIKKNKIGEFQFGLVSGQMDGEIINSKEGKKFEFTWEGIDECDPVSGSGWLRIKDKELLEGEFRFHLGDRSNFSAKRANGKL